MVFQVPSITAYLCLERLLTQQDFHRIRHLHLRWQFIDKKQRRICELRGQPPCDINTWSEICSSLESMAGLQTLRVDMVVPYYVDMDEWSEGALLHCLHYPSRTAEVEVYVSWPRPDGAGRWTEDRLFRLTRDARDSILPVWWDSRKHHMTVWGRVPGRRR